MVYNHMNEITEKRLMEILMIYVKEFEKNENNQAMIVSSMAQQLNMIFIIKLK